MTTTSQPKPIPDLSISGGTLLCMDAKNTIIENAQVDVQNGRIVAIGTGDPARPNIAKQQLDARQCLILPGFFNGHTHTGMTLLRGIADDMPLHQWLHERIFPLEKQWGSPEFVYTGTLLAMVEMIRSGTTTFNDMYYFEDSAARAVQEAGMRAILGQTIIEISGVEKQTDLFEKFDAYLEAIKNYPRVMGAIAPHSIYGVSEPVWEEVVEYAHKRQLLVHVHLQETQEELDDCLKTRKMTPTQFFEKIGLWKQRSLVAHATCMTDVDIEILGRYKVGVAHNPESNLKLGTRISPVVELRRAGAKLVLGTDGTSSNNNLDLLQEADTAAKLQVFRKGIGELKALEIVKMLTLEGAEALGLSSDVGSIEVGKAADFIAIDISGAHATPLYNPYSHLVYSASGHDVKHSVVGGTVLMQDRKLLTLDEEAILKEARDWGHRIAKSLPES